MNCTDIQNLLSDYSAGLVHGRQLAEIESHLDTCPSCTVELERLERVVFLVEGLDVKEPPVGLWNGVYNRVAPEQQVVKKKSLWESILPAFRHSAARWSIGLATAALAGVLAFSRVHTPVPASYPIDGGFVQGHVMYSSQEFFADDVALNSVAALAEREQYRTEQL